MYQSIRIRHPYSVKPKSTWAILKPHVETLTSSFIFPTLVFDAERAELWSSDPLEYARRSVGACTFRPVCDRVFS